MTAVLLDTTVASLLHPRKARDAVRTRYEKDIQGNIPALSFQSVAELWLWSEQNDWGAKSRAGLAIYLQRFVIIPYDAELGKVWAQVMASSRKQGRRLEAGDAWIAATAIHHHLRLLTHDRDFLPLKLAGLDVVSYT